MRLGDLDLDLLYERERDRDFDTLPLRFRPLERDLDFDFLLDNLPLERDLDLDFLCFSDSLELDRDFDFLFDFWSLERDLDCLFFKVLDDLTSSDFDLLLDRETLFLLLESIFFSSDWLLLGDLPFSSFTAVERESKLVTFSFALNLSSILFCFLSSKVSD